MANVADPSEQNFGGEEDEFDSETAELQRWPYVVNLIDGTLDTPLIESKGKQLLFQALSNKNLLAFVGSGLSAAYGRLSWTEWQERQVSRLEEIAEAYIACCEKSKNLIGAVEDLLRLSEKIVDPDVVGLSGDEAKSEAAVQRMLTTLKLAPSSSGDDDRRSAASKIKHLGAFLAIKQNEIRFRSQEVARLSNTLMLLKNADAIPGGEPAPVVFQAAEKLKEALERNDGLFAGNWRTDPDWNPAATAPKDLVAAIAKHALPGFNVKASAGPAPDIEAIIEHLESFKVHSGHDADFLKKKLERFANARRDYDRTLRDLLRKILVEEAALSFSDLTKVLMVDECAQAETYLWRATLYERDAGRKAWDTANRSNAIKEINSQIRWKRPAIRPDNLRRKVRGIREFPERFWSLGYFRSDTIKSLSSYILSNITPSEENPKPLKYTHLGHWKNLLYWVDKFSIGNNNPKDGQRREHSREIVSPTHRFVLEMMLDLVEDPYRELTGWKDDKRKPKLLQYRDIEDTDFRSRHSVIDTDLDPIQSLVMNMGIRRYLTTNYDMEIERFFHDRGYRKYESDDEDASEAGTTPRKDKSGVYRVDELGGVFKDHTFERDSAGDLVQFSVDDADADGHVFHLHGRATEGSKIVVTERDYMDLYLRNDMNRDSVDEGIRLAFSGNPLFFVGLGMQEADVLRPLRQFMSDRDRAIDRTAIVLSPAEKPLAARARFATGLYLRYGVHTIFYGSGRIISQNGVPFEDAPTVDWLHYTMSLIGELRTINTELQELLRYALALKDGKAPNQPIKLLNSKWSGKALLKRVIDGLAERDPEFTGGHPAAILNTLLGRAKDADLDTPSDLDKPDGSDGKGRLAPVSFIPRDDYAQKDVLTPQQAATRADRFLEFESFAIFELLRITVQANGPISRIMKKLQAIDADAKDATLPSDRVLLAGIREVRARLVALNGLQTAVLTGTLCATLDALTVEWQTWWTHWRQSPPHRIARFERRLPSNFRDEATGEPIVHPPLRYVRHLLRNRISELDQADGYSSKLPLLNLAAIAPGAPTTDLKQARLNSLPETGVRAFDTFLDAVFAEQHRQPWFNAATTTVSTEGSFAHRAELLSTKQPMSVSHTRMGANPLDMRRTYLVAAKRGLGKGTFFSAFFSSLGLSSYIRAAWPINHRTRHPYFISAFFVNFSFSSEIASAYDMLIDALIESCVALTALPEWESQRADCHIRSNLEKLAEDPGSHIHDLIDDHRAEFTALRAEAMRLFDQGRDDDVDLARLVAILRGERQPEGGLEVSATTLQLYKYAIRESLAGLPRLELLTHLFKAFSRLSKAVRIHKASTTYRPRLLLVVNALELLHYAGGLPKNREIEAFLRLLASEQFAPFPLDIVLVSGEQNLGEIFVKETPFLKSYRNAFQAMQDKVSGTEFRDLSDAGIDPDPSGYRMHFVSIERQNLPATGRSNVALRQLSSGVDCLPLSEADNLPVQDRCYVHFGREANSERILVDNFRLLAIFLFLLDAEKRVNAINSNDERIASCRTKLGNINSDKGLHHTIFTQHTADEDIASLEKAVVDIQDEFTESLRQLNSELDSLKKEKASNCKKIHLVQELHSNLQQIIAAQEPAGGDEATTQVKALLLARYDADHVSANMQAIREWKGIRQSLRSNRYCMTILLAAAQRIALGERTIRDGAEKAEAFIRRVSDEAAIASSSRVEQVVLDKVLDAHERFHILGEPRYDLELQMLIMRHLAVIGAPCSVDVLVRMPEIRRYFDDVLRTRQNSRQEMLTEALKCMAGHGLVFELHPHPRLVQLHDRLSAPSESRKSSEQTQTHDAGSEKDRQDKIAENAKRLAKYYSRPAKDEARYTLHRLTQRHVIQKMGSGPHEYIEINSFAPSTYASMPSELPRLTHEAYTFLNSLVAALSQYPDHARTEGSTESWHLGAAPLSTRVQSLRAALCIVRSTFSVAVVSRFEDYKHLGSVDDEAERGYFEAYRVQVRWIIRKAWELLDKDKVPADYDAASEWRHINALYRDEIVWLYNECGLICLVQGNLIDAVALLRQAIRFNRVIEGPIDGGAQHNRVSLNLAIVQIERGRLTTARRRLEAIQATEVQASGRRGRLWFIVHGYLGFISHLSGDREAAARRYREALAILEVYNDRRACSIFSRHLGDLERTQGNLEQARRHVNEAISFAEAGGHEDLHKKARLALIRLDIAELRDRSTGVRPHSHNHSQSLVARIGVIEDYAQVMDMPALLCEALHTRAAFLADHGETALAGTLLTRAMAIAKRNGMELRLNHSMTLYASVLSARGLPSQARKLLFGCLEMAKRHGNQIQIERIESLFDQI